MPPLPMPDLRPGKLSDLVKDLHDLHRLASWPSVRDMAKGQTFSYATVHDLFTKPRDRAPQAGVLLSVVEYLASRVRKLDVEQTVDRFDEKWRAAAETPFDTSEPDPVAEPATADVSVAGLSCSRCSARSRVMSSRSTTNP